MYDKHQKSSMSKLLSNVKDSSESIVDCYRLAKVTEKKEHLEKYRALKNKFLSDPTEEKFEEILSLVATDNCCAVCLSALPNCMVIPCNHIVYCQKCYDSVPKEYKSFCPKCREPITDTMKVFYG